MTSCAHRTVLNLAEKEAGDKNRKDDALVPTGCLPPQTEIVRFEYQGHDEKFHFQFRVGNQK